MTGNQPEQILSVWEVHRNAPWPRLSDPNEGQLMTLDTVISGCVTYYLESPEGLDDQRIEMLESCQTDLTALLPDLTSDVSDYFARLSRLASLLLRDPRR
jgi:hypothetical protein